MRTTLTLDDDVATRLQRLQKETDHTFRSLVNEALRRGLSQIANKPKRPKGRYTKPVSGGRLLIASIDCVSTALELAEGPDSK